MKYYCGMTLYFKEYWARLMAKAYIWQTLGVSIRNEFPSVRDVLETKETVEVRFKDGDSLESQLKARDFYRKLEEAGIERSKYFNGVGIETFIFKRDKSIAVSVNGIHYQKNERN